MSGSPLSKKLVSRVLDPFDQETPPVVTHGSDSSPELSVRGVGLAH